MMMIRLLGDSTNFETRIWYKTYNATSALLQSGGAGHALGITLSGGWDMRHGAGKNGASVLVRRVSTPLIMTTAGQESVAS